LPENFLDVWILYRAKFRVKEYH